MAYTLAIGDRNYSSWSLRGWLLFAKFGIPVTVRHGRLYTDEIPDMLKDFGGARTVPAVVATGENPAVFWDSLAIAETLAERHPQAGHWPRDPAARARARSVAAEMHSGFQALRSACPMNLHHQWQGFEETAAVQTDLRRIELVWSTARQLHGKTGPWLFGTYSVADVFFAPVAARIAAYALQVSDAAQQYANLHLVDPTFVEWRRLGLADYFEQPKYQRDFSIAPWPAAD